MVLCLIYVGRTRYGDEFYSKTEEGFHDMIGVDMDITSMFLC